MKVVNVEFVENEMVELNVAQIGSNWGWIEVEGGDENDYKKIDYITNNSNPLPPTPHPLPNQSKPIVNLSLILVHYNL